jgi:hypothetical protein
MAMVLHLLKGGETSLALATIEAQLAAGDKVAVALLHDVAAPQLPASVGVLRVPQDASWERLLEMIFASDHVITW